MNDKPNNSLRKTPKPPELIWEVNYFKKKARVLYDGQEYGHLKVKGFARFKAEGKVLDREISIKSVNFWGTRYSIMDETGGQEIAVLTISYFWKKVKIMPNTGGTFRWKSSMWNSSWAWEKLQDEEEEQRDSIKGKSFFTFFKQKGYLKLGNAEEENLNAMIAGGLFARILQSIRRRRRGG